jgi:hypothetical protein
MPLGVNYTYKIPKDASYVTLRNQNRMLYANYRIQQNNVQEGCQGFMRLENGGPADADIIPRLLEGARETTAAEIQEVLNSESCPVAAPVPAPIVSTGIGGSISFTLDGVNTTSVSYPNSSALAIGTSNFTIEWFQYWTGGQFPRPFSIGTYTEGDISIGMSYEGDIYFWINNNPTSVSNNDPPLNTWTHMAIVGTGGNTISVYQGGSRIYTGSLSYNFTDSTTALAIGNETVANNFAQFIGQITNFRWVKGTALYSGASLTVPTAPLTAVSGTQLLLLASTEGTAFADSSPANRTPTNSGASFSTTNPF